MTHDQMKETMACQVCGKPKGLALDKCYTTIGKKNPLCNEYGKCRIAEKTEQQFNYGFSEVDKNIFLKACPGSGKTEVVGLKTAYEIKRWSREVGGIAVLTFTNNAADVISERVSQFAGIEKIKYPHFIGTFDSWLHGYIAHPFGYIAIRYKGKEGDYSLRVIDHKVNSKFLENKKFNTRPYREKGTIKANKYYRERKIKKYVYCDNKKGSLDFACEDDLEQTKRNFLESGFATYQDVENICFEILSKQKDLAGNIAQRFPLIIVDECQDLSWIQLQILKKLKEKGSKLHFVGDLNQAIYGFKKVEPKDVEDFVKIEGFKEKPLSDNFRSCQPIVNLCQRLVVSDDSISGMSDQKLKKPCICLIYEDKRSLSKLPCRFEGCLKKEGLDIKESAILTKSWPTVSKMRPSGDDTKVNKPFTRLAMAIYLWKTGGIQAIGDAIKYMGHFFSEKYFGKYSSSAKKHYCPECVDSSIKWRVFIKEVLDKCIEDKEIIDFSKTESQWAKIIKSRISEIVKECKHFLKDSLDHGIAFPDFDGIQATQGNKDKIVERLFSEYSTTTSNIHITTIHSAKGKTYDAVMVVSAPNTSKSSSKDNHWEHWLDRDNNPEAARLAYVASSRPKYLLVWAVPELSKPHINRLQGMGFTIEPLIDTKN